MIKSKLTNGTAIFVIKIEHYVKLRDFAIALTDHFYRQSIDFDNKITKREAIRILKLGLFHNGLNGEYESTTFEGSFELGGERNKIYEDSEKWVSKNYPYLT